MSQRALADRSGLSRSYLCDIEKGRTTRPGVGTLDRLAAALGATRADLLRAAGLLEPAGHHRETDAEGRLLAVYRGLSEAGRETVLRFARFTHADEHHWTQPPLMESTEPDGAATDGRLLRHPAGPTLFDVDGAG